MLLHEPVANLYCLSLQLFPLRCYFLSLENVVSLANQNPLIIPDLLFRLLLVELETLDRVQFFEYSIFQLGQNSLKPSGELLCHRVILVANQPLDNMQPRNKKTVVELLGRYFSAPLQQGFDLLVATLPVFQFVDDRDHFLLHHRVAFPVGNSQTSLVLVIPVPFFPHLSLHFPVTTRGHATLLLTTLLVSLPASFIWGLPENIAYVSAFPMLKQLIIERAAHIFVARQHSFAQKTVLQPTFILGDNLQGYDPGSALTENNFFILGGL